jgi:CysZ protein
MKQMLKSFPVAVRMIIKDPVNLLLAFLPTLIALSMYFLTIAYVYKNSDRFISLFQGYIQTSDQATFFAKILTAVVILFIFFFMSWTFVFVAGIIAAPFNSVLSSRIERKLIQHLEDPDKKEAFHIMRLGMLHTLKNELKKILLIVAVAFVAFFLNLFPLLYPVGIFLVSVLLAVQFIDYSWSRHDWHFSSCLKDLMVNIIP